MLPIPDMAKLYDFAKNCRNRPGSAYYEEVSAALQEGVTSVLMESKASIMPLQRFRQRKNKSTTVKDKSNMCSEDDFVAHIAIFKTIY